MQRLIESCQLFIVCCAKDKSRAAKPAKSRLLIISTVSCSRLSTLLRLPWITPSCLSNRTPQDTTGHHILTICHAVWVQTSMQWNYVVNSVISKVADGGYDSKPIFLCNFCIGRCKHLPYGRETRHCNFFPDTSCPLNTLFPQTVWPQWAVLTVRVKAQCLNRGGIRRVRHFPCKFPCKMALVKYPCAFRLRRLAQNETSHTEILPRGSLYRDLAKRPLIEILYSDLARTPLLEILYRDIA